MKNKQIKNIINLTTKHINKISNIAKHMFPIKENMHEFDIKIILSN